MRRHPQLRDGRTVLGIDPGPVNTASVRLGPGGVEAVRYGPWSEALADWEPAEAGWPPRTPRLAIETVQPRAQPMSRVLLETAVVAGRLLQVAEDVGRQARLRGWSTEPPVRITPSAAYRQLLGRTGKKSELRVAIRDLYGDTDREAYGVKKDPGPLYLIRRSGIPGAADHLLSALAVALAYGLPGGEAAAYQNERGS